MAGVQAQGETPYEEQRENQYDRTRIYHRYRIRGLRAATKTGTISALAPQPLPFVSDEEKNELLEVFADPESVERGRLLHKFLEAVAQDGTALKSKLTPVVPSNHPGFDEFRARHEERAKLVIRLFEADVRNPTQVYKFGAFISMSGDPDVFLLNSRLEIADAFLKRLASRGLTISHAHIDLQRLSEEGNSVVRGGSFSIKGRPTLTTAMVFGPQVNEDDSWAEYSSIGQLRYIHLQLVVAGHEVKMMVTSRGSLLPYGVDDIGGQLALVTDVYEQYLKQFETNEQILR